MSTPFTSSVASPLASEYSPSVGYTSPARTGSRALSPRSYSTASPLSPRGSMRTRTPLSPRGSLRTQSPLSPRMSASARSMLSQETQEDIMYLLNKYPQLGELRDILMQDPRIREFLESPQLAQAVETGRSLLESGGSLFSPEERSMSPLFSDLRLGSLPRSGTQPAYQSPILPASLTESMGGESYEGTMGTYMSPRSTYQTVGGYRKQGGYRSGYQPRASGHYGQRCPSGSAKRWY